MLFNINTTNYKSTYYKTLADHGVTHEVALGYLCCYTFANVNQTNRYWLQNKNTIDTMKIRSTNKLRVRAPPANIITHRQDISLRCETLKTKYAKYGLMHIKQKQLKKIFINVIKL